MDLSDVRDELQEEGCWAIMRVHLRSFLTRVSTRRPSSTCASSSSGSPRSPPMLVWA